MPPPSSHSTVVRNIHDDHSEDAISVGAFERRPSIEDLIQDSSDLRGSEVSIDSQRKLFARFERVIDGEAGQEMDLSKKMYEKEGKNQKEKEESPESNRDLFLVERMRRTIEHSELEVGSSDGDDRSIMDIVQIRLNAMENDAEGKTKQHPSKQGHSKVEKREKAKGEASADDNGQVFIVERLRRTTKNAGFQEESSDGDDLSLLEILHHRQKSMESDIDDDDDEEEEASLSSVPEQTQLGRTIHNPRAALQPGAYAVRGADHANVGDDISGELTIESMGDVEQTDTDAQEEVISAFRYDGTRIDQQEIIEMEGVHISDDDKPRPRDTRRFYVVVLCVIVLALAVSVSIPLASNFRDSGTTVLPPTPSTAPSSSVFPSSVPSFAPTISRWTQAWEDLTGLEQDDKFGTKIVWKADKLFVGAPGYNNGTGMIRLYQTHSDGSVLKLGDFFGDAFGQDFGTMFAVSTNGEVLAVLVDNSTIHFDSYNTDTHTWNRTIPELRSDIPISTFDLSGNAKVVVSILTDGTLQRWGLDSEGWVATPSSFESTTPLGPEASLQLSEEGNLLIVSDPERNITRPFSYGALAKVWLPLDYTHIGIGNSETVQRVNGFQTAGGIALSRDRSTYVVVDLQLQTIQAYEFFSWSRTQFKGSTIFPEFPVVAYVSWLSGDGNAAAIGQITRNGTILAQVFDFIDGNWLQRGSVIEMENVTAVAGVDQSIQVSLSDDGALLAVGIPIAESTNRVLQPRVVRIYATSRL